MAALVVSTGDLMMFGISAVALIVLAYVIQKTRLGRALRAVSFDRDTAQLMGIDSTRIIQLAFVISGILAGIAGVFLGIKYTLYPTLGSLVVKGFIASVIGGLGSLTGAVIGALLLGILETILLAALGSGYSTIAVFAVMLVFLLIRPQGIAGSNVQEKSVRRISHNERTCIQRTYAGFHHVDCRVRHLCADRAYRYVQLGAGGVYGHRLLCIGAFGHPRPRSFCLGGAAGGRGGNADRLCDRLPRCPAAP
mgnify:FL=1